MPSKTPPPPCMGVQSFYKIFGLETIVGSKCLLCYTGSRQDVGRKYDETKVSKVFNAFNSHNFRLNLWTAAIRQGKGGHQI